MLLPGANGLAILEQYTFSNHRQADLESDPAFAVQLITHQGGGFEPTGGETKAAGRSGQVIADERMTAAERIQDHTGIRCSIRTKWVGNNHMVINGSEVKFIWEYGPS